MRKIIQFSVEARFNDPIVVLCDDGTMWSMGSSGWSPLERIPQEPSAPGARAILDGPSPFPLNPGGVI